MEPFMIIVVSVIAGFIAGAIEGWRVGKKKRKLLIAFLANRMEQLRTDSKIKVVHRDAAKSNGDYKKSDDLTRELGAESIVFYAMQRSISEWCINNNDNDPFAI